MVKANHAFSNSALIDKLTMTFNRPTMDVLKSWCTGGAQNKDFNAVPQRDLISV